MHSSDPMRQTCSVTPELLLSLQRHSRRPLLPDKIHHLRSVAVADSGRQGNSSPYIDIRRTLERHEYSVRWQAQQESDKEIFAGLGTSNVWKIFCSALQKRRPGPGEWLDEHQNAILLYTVLKWVHHAEQTNPDDACGRET
ncbi:pfs domain-containing protein [Colletotrichum sojae]|uniref:Pfs domain-containing protein n=1 Tax=Colletotrichum sojae TaxID=2175907 RepID=A0A8H6JF40_9PEZI|nr:pfs domain-containing protein [Colletotrichum sojae]